MKREAQVFVRKDGRSTTVRASDYWPLSRFAEAQERYQHELELHSVYDMDPDWPRPCVPVFMFTKEKP
jgi:hypothetical protein